MIFNRSCNFLKGHLLNILDSAGYIWSLPHTLYIHPPSIYIHTYFILLSNCKKSLSLLTYKNMLQTKFDPQASVCWPLIYSDSFKAHWRIQHQTEWQAFNVLKEAFHSSSPKLSWYGCLRSLRSDLFSLCFWEYAVPCVSQNQSFFLPLDW